MAERHVLIIHTAADPERYIPRLRSLGFRFTLMKKRPTDEDRACFERVIDLDFQADVGRTVEAARRLHEADPIDGVMSFSESGVLPASLVSRALGLPGNPPAAALRARNKYLMRRALKAAGLSTPFHALVRDAAGIRGHVHKRGPMVLKPISGSSSYGVIRIVPEDTEADIAAHLAAVRDYITTYRAQNPQYPFEFWLPDAGYGIPVQDVMDPAEAFLLEGFLGGQQVSVDGLVSDGVVTCLGVIEIERIRDQDYFLEYEEWMPTRLGADRERAIQAEVTKAVRALGLSRCCFHCELKVDGDAITVLEIAARRGADNISDFVRRVMGVDVYEEGIRLACGDRRVFADLRPLGAMKMRYFLPEVSGTLLSVDGFDEVRRDPSVSEVDIEFQTGDTVLTPPDGYEFLGYISVFGESLEAADACLERVYPKVRFNIVPLPCLSPAEQAETVNR